MVGSRIDVISVAKEARIALTESECSGLQCDLERVLGFVSMIDEVEVSGCEPTVSVCDSRNTLRPDIVVESVARESVLANAPVKTEFEFRLPKIVEEA